MTNTQLSTLEHALIDIQQWMDYRLTNGPIETRGQSTGHAGHAHPSGYAAVLIPDWELKQKRDIVTQCIVAVGTMEGEAA